MRTTRFTIMAIGLIVLLSSCHQKIWDTLNDHEARIARLEALCNQYNTTISSLQELVTVMQSNNYIKDVVPVITSSMGAQETRCSGKSGKTTSSFTSSYSTEKPSPSRRAAALPGSTYSRAIASSDANIHEKSL